VLQLGAATLPQTDLRDMKLIQTFRQQHAATLPLAHSGIQIVQQLRAATLLQYDTAAAATGCNIATV
jgi:hypothetical protein